MRSIPLHPTSVPVRLESDLPIIPSETPQGASGERTHGVHFYDNDAVLLDEAADFVDAALRAGGTGLVIATPEHVAQLRRRLAGFGSAEGSACWYPGRLVVLDAEATLAAFMADGQPDPQRFRAVVGPALTNAIAAGGPVHAFAEMVALLSARGNYNAAVRLEQLWTELGDEYRFSLFHAMPTSVAASGDSFTHKPVREEGGAATRVHHEQRARQLEAEIARRKEAELTLRRREKEFADFVENAAEGLHRVAGDGTILWANRAELQMLGYSWEEYVGRHIADFHVDAPVIEHILTTLSTGGTLYDQPARLRCKDGSIRHVVIHSNGYFEDGQLRYTRCFTRDATERHQRDAALAQRDRMLLNAPVATALLTGPQLRFRLANRRFCELVGRSDLEAQAFGDAFPHWQGSAMAALVEQVYRSGQPVAEQELCVMLARADGGIDERFLRLSLEPLTDVEGSSAGDEQGVILVAADVTEQVHSRRSLERAHAEREGLLEELTAANRTKDEFLAMLGHELRNPLSPIVTALQLMRMRGESAALREREIIERQVEHLVRLVDDLLDVARATRGQLELKCEQVDVSVPVNKAVEMASPLLAQRGHRLAVEIEPGILWEGDAMRLAQVVSNLLTNAARYTEPGGEVKLQARRGNPGWLRIGVSDNGIGLAPEMLEQVFGLFFQGKRSVDRIEGGLGIGLALVRNIVELHGGEVEAHSAGLGQGSEFVVCLPLKSGGAALDAAEPAEEPAPAAGGQRIMVVDDNVDAADLLGQLLTAHGHRVAVFHDPLAALEAAPRLRPDLAVLDIGLPGMDGYELATRLRGVLGTHPCRLVALSGYGQEGDRLRSEHAGFAQHLVKPIGPDQVAQLATAP